MRIERENEELEKFLVGGGRGRFGEIQSIKERREEGEEDRKGWNTGDLLDGGDGIVV